MVDNQYCFGLRNVECVRIMWKKSTATVDLINKKSVHEALLIYGLFEEST